MGISHEDADRTFQYRIPEEFQGKIRVGQRTRIPFRQGNRQRRGYVVDLTDQVQVGVHKLKDVAGTVQGNVTTGSQLTWLARWMKKQYGSTMDQALKAVLPVKQKVREAPKQGIRTLMDRGVPEELAEEAGRKKHKAKLRLLGVLFLTSATPYEEVVNRLDLTPSAIKPFLEVSVITVEVVEGYRNPLEKMKLPMGSRERNQAASDDRRSGLWGAPPELNPFQREITDAVIGEYDRGIRRIYLPHGVTGSNKVEVCMELIAHILLAGRRVIVPIPEISFTWQTVMRFYSHFDNRVLVMNFRISAGERYNQYERARTGDINIATDPRPVPFAPFENLGLAIVDEKHENAHKSELSPRYDAREAAARRAQMNKAPLVLGSATPSLESYTRAIKGEYELFTLKERVKENARLPLAEIIDLREELEGGNRSILGRHFKALIGKRLKKRERVMLFINRRGYANFVSCRSCGGTVKCPHCDMTLTLHRDGCMMCHYRDYSIPQPKKCPVCGPPHITPFSTRAQKIEAMAAEPFPKAKILRMDLDTTPRKGDHQEILFSLVRGEADILVGTQTIVKDHDFSKMTLVGALVTNLSLYALDYRREEQAFALLTQVAGWAEKGQLAGNMVIQTYQLDHYSIRTAAAQDYKSFYSQEMIHGRLLGHPSAVALLTVQMVCSAEGILAQTVDLAAGWMQQWVNRMEREKVQEYKSFRFVGPVNAAVYKVNDIYREILYIKHRNYDMLIQIRKMTGGGLKGLEGRDGLTVQYDSA